MINIAAIDNLSAAAWRLLPAPPSACVHYAPPNAIYRALREGVCDAGLLPTARLMELSHRFVPLGAHGIACTGAVGSVLLLHHLPLEEMLDGKHPVHVTRKSETSRQLLRLLARRSFGMEFEESPHTDAPAKLVIGDDAILALHEGRYPRKTDLGAWWHASTGLPFVFAQWVIRRDLPANTRNEIRDWVAACAGAALPAPMQPSPALLDHHPSTQSDAYGYYRKLRYTLTDEDFVGLCRFQQLQREASLCRHTA